MPNRYRYRPRDVEAMQVEACNQWDLAKWCKWHAEAAGLCDTNVYVNGVAVRAHSGDSRIGKAARQTGYAFIAEHILSAAWSGEP